MGILTQENFVHLQSSSLFTIPFLSALLVGSFANLKTASRLLDAVFYQCGARYRNVVESCLFWPGIKVEDMDDEDFERAVFDTVVQPLLEDLSEFEGLFERK
jgi:hypothetical protein